jgi:glucose-6-phosphate-specific signal transduction histidine kinase
VSALAIASAYWLLVDGPLSAKLNDLAIVTSGVALQPILAQYRHQADMVDIARDRSVHEAAALAVARERRQSQRALHDAALQILEAVSGGWAPDDELLLSQIDFELMRLRDELALAAPRASAALVEHLDRLAALLKRTGLEVELDTSQLGEPRLADDALAALSGALAEACTNVRKHANATLVTLTASSTQGRVVVSARDNGIGFDISAGQGGFGIRESILARVRSVGGDAVVAPSRQRGTRVTAWVPL